MLTFAVNHSEADNYHHIRIQDRDREHANLEITVDGKLYVAFSAQDGREVELQISKTAVDVMERTYDKERGSILKEPVATYNGNEVAVGDTRLTIRHYRYGKTIRILRESGSSRETYLYIDIHHKDGVQFSFGGVEFEGLSRFATLLLENR